MRKWAKQKHGFTIIELLIVIVIIAILAAITLVAYNGITARAYDSAVKNDLSHDVKNVELYKVDNGKYPESYTNLVAMKTAGYPLVASQSSYDTSTNNYVYCMDSTDGTYAIVVRSKSGKVWYISDSNSVPTVYPTSWNPGVSTLCSQVVTTYSNGQWVYQSGAWSTAML